MILRTLQRASCSGAKASFRQPQWARHQIGLRVFTRTSGAFKETAKESIAAQIQREPRAADNVPGTKPESATRLGAATPAAPRKDPLALGDKSNKEQRKADWAILKEMAQYLWPKDSFGTRARVLIAVALLVGSKVLNVQVPFYFKSIVDSMNIDFAAVGGTATTVAGSMIMACKLRHAMLHLSQHR